MTESKVIGTATTREYTGPCLRCGLKSRTEITNQLNTYNGLFGRLEEFGISTDELQGRIDALRWVLDDDALEQADNVFPNDDNYAPTEEQS